MRIGEIAVVSPHAPAMRDFIRNVCDEVEIQNDDFIFGSLTVSNQLLLHLYGVNDISETEGSSWELVSSKLLGYIILFNWQESDSIEKLKRLVDNLEYKQTIATIIVAHVESKVEAIPEELLNDEFKLSGACSLTFCNVTERESARQPLVILLDKLLAQIG